jgi:putative methyltransferase (TIGR04325 family)
MKITQLIPPILIPVLRRINPSKGIKVYQNYASALSDCSKLGYEDSDLVNVVVEKTRIFRNEIDENKIPLFINSTNAFSLCSILATLDTRMQVNVLDFGGAAGAHYFIARKIIPKNCALKWMVVETPAMVKRAAPLLSNDELSFSPLMC